MNDKQIKKAVSELRTGQCRVLAALANIKKQSKKGQVMLYKVWDVSERVMRVVGPVIIGCGFLVVWLYLF